MRDPQPWDDPDSDPVADTRAWAEADAGDRRPEPVMQPRCLFCGHTHYGPSVLDISSGLVGCERCGRVPPVFYSESTYAAARRIYYHQRREG